MAGGIDSFTKAVMHFDGSNGATTTIDEIGHSVTMTNTTLSTAQAKFGPSSMLPSASTAGNGTQVGSGSADFVFGTGDWFAGGWVYSTAAFALSDPVVLGIGQDGTGMWFRVQAGTFRIFWSAASNDSGSTVPNSQWVFLGGSRLGSTIYYYMNSGTPVGSFSAGAYSHTSATGAMFGGRAEGSSVQSVTGHLDEWIVKKGVGYSSIVLPTGPYDGWTSGARRIRNFVEKRA